MVITLKQFYKYFGIIAIMLFSFYYTERIALFMIKSDPIYETIEDVSSTTNVNYVNAIIKDNTIIPGVNGLEVNAEKSFQKMKSFGASNKYYLIFDQVKPDISLEDNKDKIITEGNASKKSVAIILSNQKVLIDYFQKNQIQASVLITKETLEKDSKLEQINDDSKYMKETDNLLDSLNQNKNICIVNAYNQDTCQKEKKYLVKPSLNLNRSNIASIKGKIQSGSIILIEETATLEDVKILLNQINYKGLSILTLSELIMENNEIEQR